VNFVGVDVNSASPALLRYVSGMNALTARRVYEHRREKGPFQNREQLKEVQGFGEQTFVQAAGFLKVIGGENPLDATWIHPESYDIARRVLDKLGCDVADLAKTVPAPAKEEPKREFAADLVQQEGVAGEGAVPAEPLSREGEPPAEPHVHEQTIEGTPEPSTQYSVLGTSIELADTVVLTVPEEAAVAEVADAIASAPELSPPLPLSPSPAPEAPAETTPVAHAEPAQSPRGAIAERAANVDVHQLAAELGVGTHLLQDILTSLTRPALDPRDSLPPPVFRRGIMKLEDLTPGMELAGTVLNVVDFGVFVDIGLSDSGLVHISRLADRFIRDPHEVVGVGDVIKVWVVDVDKSRRRVSLTAIPPGTERRQRPPREKQRPDQQRAPQGDRPPRRPRKPQKQGGPQQQQQQRPPQPVGAGAPAQGQRPPRPPGGGRRDQRHGGRPPHQHPKTIERPPTKPKKVKPITKAMEEGREPMRSFGDLMQLFDKKRQKPKGDEPPPGPEAASS
jgi:uncharacterized protein